MVYEAKPTTPPDAASNLWRRDGAGSWFGAPSRAGAPMRFEFVWSLAISFVILSGAVVWTAASNTAPSVGIRQTAAADPADDFKACRQYSQYEFKVGYLVAPSCLPQTD